MFVYMYVICIYVFIFVYMICVCRGNTVCKYVFHQVMQSYIIGSVSCVILSEWISYFITRHCGATECMSACVV